MNFANRELSDDGSRTLVCQRQRKPISHAMLTYHSTVTKLVRKWNDEEEKEKAARERAAFASSSPAVRSTPANRAHIGTPTPPEASSSDCWTSANEKEGPMEIDDGVLGAGRAGVDMEQAQSRMQEVFDTLRQNTNITPEELHYAYQVLHAIKRETERERAASS